MNNTTQEVPNSDNPLHDQIKVSYEETNRPYGGWEGHWTGDGSGMDDFVDYNALEGQDW